MTALPFRLGVAAEGLFQTLGANQTLRWFADRGAHWIQLDPWLLPGHVDCAPADAERFRAGLAPLGLESEALTWWPGNADAATYAAGLAKLARLVPALGVSILNVYFYPFAARARRESRAELDCWREGLAPVLAEAGKAGVTLTLEPEAHDRSGTARGCLDLLAAADFHPALAINYDPCNLYHGGDEAFPSSYEALKPYIRYVHLKNGYFAAPGCPVNGYPHPDDLPGGVRAVYTLLDRGALNPRGILQRLLADGYAGLVVLEPHFGTLAECQAAFVHELAYMEREWVALASEPPIHVLAHA